MARSNVKKRTLGKRFFSAQYAVLSTQYSVLSTQYAVLSTCQLSTQYAVLATYNLMLRAEIHAFRDSHIVFGLVIGGEFFVNRGQGLVLSAYCLICMFCA